MLYRKTFTKPLPADAELFERKGKTFARYTDARKKPRTAEVMTNEAGVQRLVFTSPYWRLRYRDGSGVVRDVPTRCRDEVAAQGVANDLLRRAELVKAGTIKPAEDAAADHQKTPIAEHFDSYIAHLRAKGVTPHRIGMVRAMLVRLATECNFRRLYDLWVPELEKWLVARQAEKMAAATRNSYRERMVGFCNWCRRTNRLVANPFLDVPIADAKADRRRQRRALTEDELSRLLTVARFRPLPEFGRDREKTEPDPSKPKRSNWRRLPLTIETIEQAAQRGRRALAKKPKLIAKLEALGHERALVYKVLVLTGLRKGELRSINVGQVQLDAEVPHLILNAADEKNRQGSEIPLRPDVVGDLRAFLAAKLKAAQDAARLPKGEPIPSKLPGNQPLFDVPTGLIRILDRDLQAAGIPKRDDRNRTVDVHAMRMTFGTHLSKAGVPLRTAQAAMRHSKPELAANVYTDPRLLDVVGALAALPLLPLEGAGRPQKLAASGAGEGSSPLLLPLASGKIGGKRGKSGPLRKVRSGRCGSGCDDCKY